MFESISRGSLFYHVGDMVAGTSDATLRYNFPVIVLITLWICCWAAPEKFRLLFCQYGAGLKLARRNASFACRTVASTAISLAIRIRIGSNFKRTVTYDTFPWKVWMYTSRNWKLAIEYNHPFSTSLYFGGVGTSGEIWRTKHKSRTRITCIQISLFKSQVLYSREASAILRSSG